jgi:hypothetical protein
VDKDYSWPDASATSPRCQEESARMSRLDRNHLVKSLKKCRVVRAICSKAADSCRYRRRKRSATGCKASRRTSAGCLARRPDRRSICCRHETSGATISTPEGCASTAGAKRRLAQFVNWEAPFLVASGGAKMRGGWEDGIPFSTSFRLHAKTTQAIQSAFTVTGIGI